MAIFYYFVAIALHDSFILYRQKYPLTEKENFVDNFSLFEVEKQWVENDLQFFRNV